MNAHWLAAACPVDIPYGFADRSLYLWGWLLWTPAYVAILGHLHPRQFRWIVTKLGFSDRKIPTAPFLEIPVIAVCANVSFEFLWGFVWPSCLPSGMSYLPWIYRLAFIIDFPIFIGVLRYGTQHLDERTPMVRRFFVPLVLATLIGWGAIYWAMLVSFEINLGSYGAYLDNVVMSVLYLWFSMSTDLVQRVSLWGSRFRAIGTGLVTVMIFRTQWSREHAFLLVMAGIVTVVDVVQNVITTRAHRRQFAKVAVPSVERWAKLGPVRSN